MRKIRYKLDDWEDWLKPYVVKKGMNRRKNQYCSGMMVVSYYTVENVPFGSMYDHNVSKHIKWTIVGNCKECGKDFHNTWSNVWLRKAFRGQEVCGKCSRKKQFTELWRKHNSEAQKRVQGTPTAREKMSKILKKSWKDNPDRKKKLSLSLKKAYKDNPEYRKKVSEASKRNWRSLDYQIKVTGHGYHHGWLLSRCGRIYFASSWELMFLLWCERNKDFSQFLRCEDRIPYEKPVGGSANYHPDFEIITKQEEKVVAEVKGGRSDIDLVRRKHEAAVRYYQGKKTYVMVFKDDLKRMGVFRGNKVGLWIQSLVEEGLVEYYGIGKTR